MVNESPVAILVPMTPHKIAPSSNNASNDVNINPFLQARQKILSCQLPVYQPATPTSLPVFNQQSQRQPYPIALTINETNNINRQLSVTANLLSLLQANILANNSHRANALLLGAPSSLTLPGTPLAYQTSPHSSNMLLNSPRGTSLNNPNFSSWLAPFNSPTTSSSLDKAPLHWSSLPTLPSPLFPLQSIQLSQLISTPNTSGNIPKQQAGSGDDYVRSLLKQAEEDTTTPTSVKKAATISVSQEPSIPLFDTPSQRLGEVEFKGGNDYFHHTEQQLYEASRIPSLLLLPSSTVNPFQPVASPSLLPNIISSGKEKGGIGILKRKERAASQEEEETQLLVTGEDIDSENGSGKRTKRRRRSSKKATVAGSGGKGGDSRAASRQDATNNNTPTGKKCFRCGTEVAPIWRKVFDVEVCNACGLYVKRVGQEALHDGGKNATSRGRPRKFKTETRKE